MTRRIAFDADVLFYAMDPRDDSKQSRCESILRQAMHATTGSLALQTISEFATAILRKGVLRKPEAIASARDWASVFAIIEATPAALDIALDWWAQDRLSYWDALLVATLSAAGITALVTEDMDNGLTIGGAEIINPFGSGADEAMERHGLTTR